MTDIVKRLNTVVTHADHGVDPYWVELAITEIQRLRKLIEDFYVAEWGEVQCQCPYLDCVCADNAYRAATNALCQEVSRWDSE
jgi:hypothetical protein